MDVTGEIFTRLTTALNDRYSIARELGQGGMATVYLAHDVRHDREVAVKVLRPELAASLGTDRFLREIQIAARLNHPHILPLYDSGAADGLLYYVMPYMEGESLRSRLAREQQLELDEAFAITRDVAAALDYAHKRGIIHRDIKPGNILLHEGEAVVADFGIALAVSVAGGDRLTVPGFSIGTAEYMSPEQSVGETNLGGQSDLYSLASVLFEMLTGEVPYPGPTATAIIARRFTDPIPSARRLRKDVPAAVDSAIVRALGAEPADRFESCTAFLEALAQEVVVRERRRDSIVVLPFKNLSPDPENEYFSDGLTEEIITSLSRIPDLRVVPRTTVMQYKNVGKSVRDIARELDVSTVLEGSVRKSGKRVRIVAQAIDATADEHLWSDTYDRTLDDIFEIQSDVAAHVSEAIQAELSAAELADLSQPGTKDVIAYDFYLKGRFLWNQRNAPALRRSLDFFSKAIERDGRFALARAALADSYTTLGIYGASPPHEVMAAAREAANEALRIDSDLAQALTARACVRAVYDWDWVSAEADFQDALRRNPDYATAHQWYALHLLAPLGRFEEANSEIACATQLEPLSSAIAASRGVLAFFSRDYDRAMDEYEAARSLHPHFGLIFLFIGQCEAARGRYEEAIRALRTADRLMPDSLETMATLGQCLAATGSRSEATELLEKLEQRAQAEYVSPVLPAHVYMGLREHEAALDMLDDAAELRSSDLIWLGVRPVFDPLRSESRFDALLRRMGHV